MPNTSRYEENKKRKEPTGIRLTTTSISILVAVLVVCISLFSGIFKIYDQFDAIVAGTEHYIEAGSYALMLQKGSDYLTEKARQSVINLDVNSMYSYFAEVNDNRRRDQSILKVKASSDINDPDIITLLEEAKRESDELIGMEIHAMRVAAFVIGSDEDIPKEVKEYQLSADEMNMDRADAYNYAVRIVLSNDYVTRKNRIDSIIATVNDKIKRCTDNNKNLVIDSYRNSIVWLRNLIVICFLLTVVMFLSIIFLVILPITSYVKSMKSEERLKPRGSLEFLYFAETYNNIFEKNAVAKLSLKEKAEHDKLTGLLNREAFESLIEFYRTSNEKMALLIIDVDKFKTVNDTYGHKVGDLALKRVADLLHQSFRSNDFPVRYGGDEFVVLMIDIEISQRSIIEQKINYINELLQNPEGDELPRLSISVGVAFSRKGYYDGLFKHADDALYVTKENGRCGYHFHGL